MFGVTFFVFDVKYFLIFLTWSFLLRLRSARGTFHHPFFMSHMLALSWTYNWAGLAALLSIFLFLIYLLIHLIVSVYILMIYKWSQIRVWCASWLNINEIQPWKFIKKIATLFFWIVPYFFSFLGLAVYEIDL